jgi:hypothetical protein
MKENPYIFYKERYLLSNPEQTVNFNLIDKDPLEAIPDYGYRYIFIPNQEFCWKFTLAYTVDSLEWVHWYKKHDKAMHKWFTALAADASEEKLDKINEKIIKAEKKMAEFSHVVLKKE